MNTIVRRQRVRRALLALSFALFPLTIYYFSPVVVLAGASMGIITGSMLVFGGQFLSGLVVGRAWCGWLCPAGGLGELLMGAVDRPARGGRWNLIKWGIWLPWVTLIALLAIRAGGLPRLDPLYMTEGGLPLSDISGYIVYLAVVSLVAILSLSAGRRAFCHYACWMAPFMILGRRVGRWLGLSGLYLIADPGACIDCMRCNDRCPMSLNVHAMVRHGSMADDECILCGMCADGCPRDVLSLRWGQRPRIAAPILHDDIVADTPQRGG